MDPKSPFDVPSDELISDGNQNWSRSQRAIEDIHLHMGSKRPAHVLNKVGKMPVDERDLMACYVRDQGRLVRVVYDSILMLKAEGNYVEICTTDSTLTLHNSLADVQAQLDDPRFLQVNRSTAVNINHILQVEHDSVLVGKEHVTLSRNHRKDLLDRLQVVNSK
jgi:DNA-binding LytR/AlgR family response regulator